jgi:hypothetical protein
MPLSRLTSPVEHSTRTDVRERKATLGCGSVYISQTHLLLQFWGSREVLIGEVADILYSITIRKKNMDSV